MEPDKFWLEQAATLDWFKKPTRWGPQICMDTRRKTNRAHVV